MDQLRSHKTTWAAVVAAVGLLATLVGHALRSDDVMAELMKPENVAQLVAAFGVLMTGLFARDDDVTSEGTRAPKDDPEAKTLGTGSGQGMLFLFALLSLGVFLPSCAGLRKVDPETGDVTFDRDALHREFVAFDEDANEFKSLLDPAADASLIANIDKYRAALASVDKVLMTTEDPATWVSWIDSALRATPEVQAVFDPNPERQQRARVLVFAARSFLRHVRTLAGAPEPPPSSEAVDGSSNGLAMVGLPGDDLREPFTPEGAR